VLGRYCRPAYCLCLVRGSQKVTFGFLQTLVVSTKKLHDVLVRNPYFYADFIVYFVSFLGLCYGITFDWPDSLCFMFADLWLLFYYQFVIRDFWLVNTSSA
jgi:hypothetical protein